MKLLCIDPGTTHSGVVVLKRGNIVDYANAHYNNVDLLHDIDHNCFNDNDLLVIEMVANYGMPVGTTTLETCVWIGQFIHAFKGEYTLAYRKDVKLHLCGTYRSKDANVRQAILDLFPATGGGKTPQVGTKKKPGPLYGVTSHAMSALAIGMWWSQMNGGKNEALQCKRLLADGGITDDETQ